LCSRVCSSSAITLVVRGLGLGSLHPSPARSSEHTRVNCAARGWTLYHDSHGPASMMTVGEPSPVQ
jgi:hypothetical protein